MTTKERLARVLEEAKLRELALRARLGEFDDFESDSATPIHDLVHELINAGREDLAKRAMQGEFDATKEEAEAWHEREGRKFEA